jgi:hypothetical protein
MKPNKIVYATYAFNAKKADYTPRLRHGDLEIILRNGIYHFVSNGGAQISNIRDINFVGSILKGITDDISKIDEKEHLHYALAANTNKFKIGQFELNEEMIKSILDNIEELIVLQDLNIYII